MKAVRIHSYGGPDVLSYEDAPDPVPGPGQVLVRLEAAAVNPIDAAIRSGVFSTPTPLPKIIGSDGAGVIESLGPEVTGLRPGDEVFFTGLGVGSPGTYAERVVVNEVQAVPKPKALTFAEAAAMGLAFATAYYGLVRRGTLQAGETVLVQGGSGGVGTAAIQLARALGARVLTTTSQNDLTPTLKDLGAEAVIDYRSQDVVAEVSRLTDGKGVDLIIELVVSENLGCDLKMIARAGRIVAIGQGPRPLTDISIGPALGKDVSLLFMSTANAGRAGTANILREVAALAEQGRLKPVVGKIFKLAEAQQAHRALAGPHLGKIVLIP